MGGAAGRRTQELALVEDAILRTFRQVFSRRQMDRLSIKCVRTPGNLYPGVCAWRSGFSRRQKAAFDQWRVDSAMAPRWPRVVLHLGGQQADGCGGDAGRGGEIRGAEGTLRAERHRRVPRNRRLREYKRREAVFVCDQRGRGWPDAIHGRAELDGGGEEMTLTTDKQLGPYEILSPLRRRW